MFNKNKNLVITLSVILGIILIFILFANPLPKREPEKSFLEILSEVKNIDIMINTPKDNESEISKTIKDKNEIDNIINLLKEINISDTIYNINNESDAFSYTLILNTKDEKNIQNISFRGNNISVNGKAATVDKENIEIIDNIVKENVTGYGILKCEQSTASIAIVEKYYFKSNIIYHYSQSKTYTPEDIKEIENYLLKITNYDGVTTEGNTIGGTKYSYMIDIDLKQISEPNFKEITNEYKLDLYEKTKEEIQKEKTGMTCTYIFLDN